MQPIPNARRAASVGGTALIVATILFGAVFSYLASAFGYPDVLDKPASEVLPALLALGEIGWWVWLLYGLIPLLLIPTARGVVAIAASSSPGLARSARPLAWLSAASMMLGLLRWPTLQWTLAEQWTSAPVAMQQAIAHRFDLANLYLGNVIGEFAGELFLNAFLLIASLALASLSPRLRWFRPVGVIAATFGWVAMLRNVTPFVATIASVNNAVLPLWMLSLGVGMIAAHRKTR